MRKAIKGIALAALLFSGTAAAVTTEGYDIPYAGVSGIFEIPDGSRDSDTGYGYHLNVGLPIELFENSAVELSFFDLKRDRDIDGKSDYQTGLFAHYVRHFEQYGWSDSEGFERHLPNFIPFALAGLGVVQDDVRGDSHEHFGVDFGGGLLFPIPFKGWAIRTEAVAQLQLNDKSVSGEDLLIDFQFRVGLQIPLSFIGKFGSSDTAAPADECPLAVVDPVSGRKDCGVDSDSDGVADVNDLCPGTPQGTPVNNAGCQVGSATDADGDGVTDAEDICPNTAIGLAVDARGCAIAQSVVLQGVKFHNASAILTDEARVVLDEVARTLSGQAGLTVEIAGHTDDVGSEDYNLKLSQQRAESVRQYLIGKGIPSRRLTAQGYGEFNPIAPNDTEAGRETNRRVEFKVLLAP